MTEERESTSKENDSRGHLKAEQLRDLEIPSGFNKEKVVDLREKKARVIEKIGEVMSGSKVKSKGKKLVFSFYSPPEKKKRELGEHWVDADGKEWVQMSGYTASVRKIDVEELVRDGVLMPWHCPKCNKSLTSGLDKKMWLHNKFCMDCTAEYETQLHIEGKYKEYERQIIMANIRAFYHDVENGIEDYVNSFDATYVNEFGDVEKWGRISKPMVRSLILNDLALLKTDFEKDFGEPLEKIDDSTNTGLSV